MVDKFPVLNEMKIEYDAHVISFKNILNECFSKIS